MRSADEGIDGARVAQTHGVEHEAKQGSTRREPGEPVDIDLPFSTEKLLRFIRHLLGSLDENRAVNVLAKELLELFRAELAAVYVATEDGPLDLRAIAGERAGLDLDALRTLQALAERAMESSSFIRAHLDEVARTRAGGRWRGETAALPLVSKGRNLGVLVLAVSDEAAADVDAVVLATLAELAASSLDNVRLFENAFREARRDPLTGLGNQRAFH